MDKKDYIFGLRAIIEAMEAGKTLDKILLRREINGELAKELLDTAKRYEVPVQKVPLEKLNRITLKNHQGAIAILSPTGYYRLDHLLPTLYEEGKTPFGIMLDGVTDARNFGAIARTAECAGADFIIIGEKASASVTSDAVKASAGALFHIPVCREKSLEEAVSKLKSNGYFVVGASEKGVEEYTSLSYIDPVVVVMGAEDTGISDKVIKKVDRLASIPIKGKIGSLNVSVAAGIFMYEIVRQRSIKL